MIRDDVTSRCLGRYPVLFGAGTTFVPVASKIAAELSTVSQNSRHTVHRYNQHNG